MVTKRKYEDLLKRAEECNDHKHNGEVTTTDEIVKNASGGPTIKRSVIEEKQQMNHSTNSQKMDSATQTIVGDQFGAGSQPFVKMSFNTFDRIHSKKARTDRKRKWMSFDL